MNIEYTNLVWSLDKEQAIKDIEQLNEDEFCFYPESDYGHGYIYKTDTVYKCYSLPMYGGEAQFENEYDNALDAFNEVLSWS